jgi:hypothetical protein
MFKQIKHYIGQSEKVIGRFNAHKKINSNEKFEIGRSFTGDFDMVRKILYFNICYLEKRSKKNRLIFETLILQTLP